MSDFPPRPPNARPDWKAEILARRAAQLQAMPRTDRQALLAHMTHEQELPQLDYHFEKHRREFATDDVEHYHRSFRRHVRRPDLRYFTFLRRGPEDAMWYLVAMDSGDVAQYNQSRRAYWSFFRPKQLLGFLESGIGWWAEVRPGQTGWQVIERWTP